MILNELLRAEDLISDYFIPSAKLVENEMDQLGRVVRRKHDTPQTPYQSLMAHEDIPLSTKQRVWAVRQSLNLARWYFHLKSQVSKTG